MATDTVVPEATAQRIGVPQGMDRALARVRSPQGEVVGSGFLVDARHVVTCTHVVLRALGRADRDTVRDGDAVAVDFPLVAADVLLPAEIAISHDVDADGGDVTVLSLTGELPPGLEPARLIVADDVWGHPFRAFGYPRRLDQGVWAAGVLRAPQGDGWVQMEAGGSGYPVEGGFSGGAVWDDELAGVVGMTVAADARPDLRAAFLIPSTTLIVAWPNLAERTLPPCPYRGLYPFRSSDTDLFFGREDVTDLLVREALRRPLLAVVGPSGSGKSSVVSAGVVPRLGREQGWMSVSMRPAQASSPLFALAAAFIPVLEPDLGETECLSAANTLVAVLRDGRLADVVDRVLARAQLNHLLLVVDQMEELFAREQDEVNAFVRALLSALQRGDGSRSRSLTVLLTLRADFLGNALQNSALAGALEDSVITIGQMRPDQLRAVIEGPLPPGVRYEAGLVERILGDVGDEPGGLPLLEFALTLLWERQQGGMLTHRAYQELGGVDGALASYAERVYSDQLLPEDQEEVRRLFVQLVRPTEVGSSVRRVARRSELGELRWQLGQRLAATRLLVADRDAAGAESIELVHEALIDGWTRLQQWTKADLAFRAWQEQLRAAVATWESVRRDPGGLLRGAPLAEAERWKQERPDDLGETERQFIRASQARRGRSVRRLRMTVAGLTVLLLLATGLGAFATIQSRRLSVQATLAGSRLLVSQAQQLWGYQPDIAMLLASAAYRMAQTPETVGAVTQMATADRQVDRLGVTGAGSVLSAEFDPVDPEKIRLFGRDAITIWDVNRGAIAKRWQSKGGIGSVGYSYDGRVIAVQEGVDDLALWFPVEDRTVRIAGADVGYDPTQGQVQLAFSPDAAMIALCSPKLIQVWETSSARLRATVAKDSESCGIGFNLSNKLTYVDRDGLALWDLDKKQRVAQVSVSQNGDGGISAGSSVYFAAAPNGALGMLAIAGSGPSTTTKIWDLNALTPLGDVGADLFADDISYTRDSRWAVVNYFGGAVLVDIGSQRLVRAYSRDDGSSYYSGYGGFSLSADGHRVVTPAGGDVLAFMETREDSSLPAVSQAAQVAVAPGPGDRFVTLSTRSSGQVTAEIPDGPPVVLVPASPQRSTAGVPVALSPDGQRAAAQGEQPDTVVFADLTVPGKPTTRLMNGDGAVSALSFDPVDGRLLATAGTSVINVWALDDGSIKARVPLKDGMRAAGVAVNRDGSMVATYDTAGNAYLSNTASATTLTLPERAVRAISFSPDGRWLGITTDTEIRLWDIALQRESPVHLVASINAGSNPSPVRFSPDGRFLAAQRVLDGYYRTSVWLVDDGELVGDVAGSAYDAAFLPDGQRLAVSGYYGLSITRFDPSSAVNTICRIVGRDLTVDEWNQYASIGLKRVSACP